MAYVEVEVDLSDFTVDELLDEIEDRAVDDLIAARFGLQMDLSEAINVLEDQGLPVDILRQVRAWAGFPVATPKRMNEWRKLQMPLAM